MNNKSEFNSNFKRLIHSNMASKYDVYTQWTNLSITQFASCCSVVRLFIAIICKYVKPVSIKMSQLYNHIYSQDIFTKRELAKHIL